MVPYSFLGPQNVEFKFPDGWVKDEDKVYCDKCSPLLFQEKLSLFEKP